MSVICRNVSFTIKDKEILRDINIDIPRNSFVSIMGPSGSGKTTLASILSGRLIPSNGKATIDGKNAKDIKREIGFVLQENLLFSDLTVEDTLLYAVKLRCTYLDQQEQMDKIQEIVSLLRLEKVLQYKIGSNDKKVLSGGEKRRVCIAIELISSPSILFLDEPTSGLDTASAIELIDTLKSLSLQGTTIICTIHQPPAQTYNMFDKLIFLVDGVVIYNDKPRRLRKYFNQFRIEDNKYMNPADIIMQKLHDLPEEESNNLKHQLTQKCINKLDIDGIDDNSTNIIPRKRLSFVSQFYILLNRSFVQFKGGKFDYSDPIATVLFLAFMMIIWYQKIRDINAVFVHQIIVYCLLSFTSSYRPAFTSIFTFTNDRAIISHELNNGSYSILAYYLSKVVMEIPLIMVHPTVIFTILYFTVGFPTNADSFIYMYLVVIANAYVSNALGLMISIIQGNAEDAAKTVDNVIAFTSLTSGLWSNNIPIWIKWLQYLSPMACAYEGLIMNYNQYSPVDIAQQLWFSNKWLYFILLCLWSTFYRIVGYLVLLKVFRVK